MEKQGVPGLVKRLRERMGLTQEQFAREVGVTFSTVNLWENGHRRPQPYLFRKLLEIEALHGHGKPSRGTNRRKSRRER